MAESKMRKPKSLQIDFTGVETRKQARRVPEGDYLLKIKDWAVGGENDKQYLRIVYDIVQGPAKGEFSDIFNLGKNSLWRLRLFLEAVGFKNLQSSVNKIPLDKLPGRTVAATIADDEYDGKVRSRPQEYFSKADFEAVSGQDEEATAASDDDDEDEDGDSDASVDFVDGDEDDDELEVIDDDDI